MAKRTVNNVEDLYNKLFTIQETLLEVLDMIDDLSISADAFGGEIQKVLGGNLKGDVLSKLASVAEGSEPSSIASLISFLDNLPLSSIKKDTRLDRVNASAPLEYKSDLSMGNVGEEPGIEQPAKTNTSVLPESKYRGAEFSFERLKETLNPLPLEDLPFGYTTDNKNFLNRISENLNIEQNVKNQNKVKISESSKNLQDWKKLVENQDSLTSDIDGFLKAVKNMQI